MSYSWGVGLSSARTDGLPIVRPLEAVARSAAAVSGTAVSGTAVSSTVRPTGLRSATASDAGTDTPPRGADLRMLAAELAPMVEVWKRLLKQHVPDRAGRCLTCTKGGTGLPSRAWPCSLHGVAELARRCHDGEHW